MQNHELTRGQVEAWNRDGFLILERLVDARTLADLRTAYDDILSGRVAVPGDRMLGQITRQVMAPSSAHPTFDDNPAVRTGMRLARQLFGTDEVARTFDMLIYKPPGHPHETPWHQDMAYGRRPFTEPGTKVSIGTIQFWVPLDDVDTENGCMQFVPGYHRRPLLEHHVASGDPAGDGRLLALVDPASQLDLTKTVVAEIPAGAATMHTDGTPHYTGPNRSANRPRRSYIFNIGVISDHGRGLAET
jgi:ectoine hydroxylase-related dioxygenase (phytanoyl-CoA dioxygenase family)